MLTSTNTPNMTADDVSHGTFIKSLRRNHAAQQESCGAAPLWNLLDGQRDAQLNVPPQSAREAPSKAANEPSRQYC